MVFGSYALSLHQGCEWGAQCEKWGHLRALSLVHCPDAVPSGEAGGRCSESAKESVNDQGAGAVDRVAYPG